MTVSVWLVSGVPGAGKSTVSKALCVRYSRAVHIPVDDIRRFVVSGCASPTDPWTSETELQFRVAHATAADMAARYVRADMAAVIEGVIDEPMYATYPELAALCPRKVLLSPSLPVSRARNHARTAKEIDAHRLDASAERLHPRLLEQNVADKGWFVIDTSALDVEQTVDAIIARYGL